MQSHHAKARRTWSLGLAVFLCSGTLFAAGSDGIPQVKLVQFTQPLEPSQNQPCSQWYVDKVLRQSLSCSTADIQAICSGQRPRPDPRATSCATTSPPPAPTGTPYQQFLQIAANNGIDMRQHPSYTEQYLRDRAHIYCELLGSEDNTKLTAEITFPPIQALRETPKDRSRLETFIMRVGTAAYCSSYQQRELNWERTYVR